jgi:glutathione S-transferase
MIINPNHPTPNPNYPTPPSNANHQEDRFPDAVPLLPLAADPKAAAVPALLRLERELFSAWLRWLTGSTVTNERQKLNFEATLGRVEEALAAAGGPYFLGEFFSVIDCIFVPFMERMAASLCFYKGFRLRGNPQFPNVERWFSAMETRESFRNIKSDWFTHAMDLPPQVGHCSMVPEGEPFAAEISGKDGSWTLPLKANGVEPLLPGSDEAAARREAATQLIANHEAVVKFAARALGEPGVPPVMAELADPNAKPNEAYLPLLDAALRVVAQALLGGGEAAAAGPGPAVAGLVAGGNVAAGLDYLRKRVGVPRDMSYEAARQFRGHLGWLIDQLQQQQQRK